MYLFKIFKHRNTKTNIPATTLNKQTAIGVDITQHTITLVQLIGHGLSHVQLDNYVITKLPKNIVKGNKIQDYDQLVTYLQHSYTQLRTNCHNIISAIPQSLATIDQISYNPKETDLNLEQFAESELTQMGRVEDMNFDYQTIDVSTSSFDQKLLFVAARKEELEPRIEMFENANLPLKIMDIDLLAQNNAYIFWLNQYAPEMANETIAIFGIYDTQMYASILQNGQIIYKQETAIGMEQLNQLIQRTYQVTEEYATQMITSITKPANYQTQIIDYFNTQVTQEIQRVLQFYDTIQVTEPFSDIKHILLTGSYSLQKGLAEAIFLQTNIVTQCLHPAAYIARNNQVDSSQLQLDAPTLTLAFGLALRGL